MPYAERLMQKFKFIYDKYKRFWRYDYGNGIWKEDAEEMIRFDLRRNLFGQEQQKNQYAKEIVSYIRDISYDSKIDVKDFAHLIAFNNCVFNLDNDETYEFSPDFFITNKIPVILDSSNNECDIIDSFFGDVVGEKYKSILYDLCGYCLLNGQPYQKLFFLTGGGANGKSTFAELLRAFLGYDNVSSITPHDICGGNRFALGTMWNKRANISTDISYELLKNINKIKEITGGDSVNIERKFKEAFQDLINAKQIFATNQPPIVTDRTHAWYRRIYLIEFPNRFEGKFRDAQILKKLTTPKQLSGLAWQALKRLKLQKANNYVFEYDIDVEKLSKIYEDLSNPLNRFVKESTDEDPDQHIWKFEFKEKFLFWLKEKGLRVWNDMEIGLFMKELFDDQRLLYKEGFGNIPDKRYRAWVGLKWKPVHTVPTVHPFTTYSIYYPLINDSMDSMDRVDTKKEKDGI